MMCGAVRHRVCVRHIFVASFVATKEIGHIKRVILSHAIFVATNGKLQRCSSYSGADTKSAAIFLSRDRGNGGTSLDQPGVIMQSENRVEFSTFIACARNWALWQSCAEYDKPTTSIRSCKFKLQLALIPFLCTS